MAFNHDQYWAEKIARSDNRMMMDKDDQAIGFLSRWFTRSESIKYTTVGHRRSLKERLMRRLRHKSRMQNVKER
jgi:hypothetical protein